MGIINNIKCKRGTKPNREAERKIFDEVYTKQMVETELYIIGWEVRKIIDEINSERLALRKLLKTS